MRLPDSAPRQPHTLANVDFLYCGIRFAADSATFAVFALLAALIVFAPIKITLSTVAKRKALAIVRVGVCAPC